MCLKDEETAHHLLIHCQVTNKVWTAMLKFFYMSWVMPKTVEDLFLQWRLRSKFVRDNILWKLVVYAMVWKLWLERNNRLFTNKNKFVEKVVKSIFWTVLE